MSMVEDEEQIQHPTNVAAAAISFNLPESIISVLPSDPFEQLDLARKITSIALSIRLAKLEDEIDGLSRTIADRNDLIADLRAHIVSLDSTLSELSGQLTRSQQEKEILMNENTMLSDTVEKLNRDLLKQVGASRMAQMQISKGTSLPSRSLMGEDSSTQPPKSSSALESGYAISNDSDYSDVDASKHDTSRGFDFLSHGRTPRLTPPGSPPRITVGLTPTRLSQSISLRRHSISVAATINMVGDKSGIFSSMPSTQHTSFTSLIDTGAQTGRIRVDGKEFFRQVRSRLSHEQFRAFLANVKELNSHNQTRGDALRKADEIFGPDNKDLYTIFEGLITRNLH